MICRCALVGIICCVQSFFSLGQSNMLDASGRKQGFWIETDIAVGRYRIECFYKDDTLHGSYKTYNKHNQLSGYATYVMGRLDGRCVDYWRKDLTRSDLNFKMGVVHGEAKIFDTKGKIHKIIEFSNGVLDGKFLVYLKGRILMETNFIQGKLDGELISYDQNGRIVTKTEFKNGDMVSGEFEFSENGKVFSMKIPNPEKDKLIKCLYYNDDGTIKMEKDINQPLGIYSWFTKDEIATGKLDW